MIAACLLSFVGLLLNVLGMKCILLFSLSLKTKEKLTRWSALVWSVSGKMVYRLGAGWSNKTAFFLRNLRVSCEYLVRPWCHKLSLGRGQSDGTFRRNICRLGVCRILLHGRCVPVDGKLNMATVGCRITSSDIPIKELVGKYLTHLFVYLRERKRAAKRRDSVLATVAAAFVASRSGSGTCMWTR